ncbi:phosphoribosylanthranilate isomerase [Halosegnis marinus]|uniref:N-(5'-phosphoribosyl)anthranilate isomerase n=1 Tax=Halosegnis marinus TaxID=3034023 RepID=A0ABD5ZLG9_9EURY|nr:phosphoribosylanthranilate isomerase [Halosegnis sp. DT85]
MARAKVCGLTSEADVRAAVEAGADAVGFIVDVDVDTPREVTPATAERLVETVPPFVTATIVTMPDSAAEAVTLAELVGADAIQTHGLPPEDVAVLVANFYGPVVPAVPTDGVADYAGVGHALLVDTPSEAGGGGTGETHDWAATREATADLDRPVILAGGLTPDNVADAVAAVDPYAVDVASGVESEGGVKDHDAVRAFVRNAGAAP